MTSSVPSTSEIASAVNVPANVPHGYARMFTAEGGEVLVREDQVEEFIEAGFRRDAFDLDENHQLVMQLLGATRLAVEELVKAVKSGGGLSRDEEGELRTAEACMATLSEAFGRFRSGITFTVALHEAEGVLMVRSEELAEEDEQDQGTETRVDPSQVEQYEERGWRQA